MCPIWGRRGVAPRLRLLAHPEGIPQEAEQELHLAEVVRLGRLDGPLRNPVAQDVPRIDRLHRAEPICLVKVRRRLLAQAVRVEPHKAAELLLALEAGGEAPEAGGEGEALQVGEADLAEIPGSGSDVQLRIHGQSEILN